MKKGTTALDELLSALIKLGANALDQGTTRKSEPAQGGTGNLMVDAVIGKVATLIRENATEPRNAVRLPVLRFRALDDRTPYARIVSCHDGLLYAVEAMTATIGSVTSSIASTSTNYVIIVPDGLIVTVQQPADNASGLTVTPTVHGPGESVLVIRHRGVPKADATGWTRLAYLVLTMPIVATLIIE